MKPLPPLRRGPEMQLPKPPPAKVARLDSGELITFPHPQWRSRWPSREARRQRATRLKFGSRASASPPLP
eukprot:7539320-Pyramimonas_sp.AAC.1